MFPDIFYNTKMDNKMEFYYSPKTKRLVIFSIMDSMSETIILDTDIDKDDGILPDNVIHVAPIDIHTMVKSFTNENVDDFIYCVGYIESFSDIPRIAKRIKNDG